MLTMVGYPWDLVIIALIFIISSALHEFAHAWVAYKCGDHTVKEDGRVSLNPLVHLGFIESFLLPLVVYYGSGGQFIFAGAKPVPVYPENLNNPHRDLCFVAIAGPIMNFIIAITAFSVLFLNKVTEMPIEFENFLSMVVLLNVLLGIFNLVPIPPLDGSRVLRYSIPPLRSIYNALDFVGIFILIALMWFYPPFYATIAKIVNAVVRFIYSFH